MIQETPKNPYKARRGSPEMHIQAECVKWLWNERPRTRNLFFHVENEVNIAGNNAALGAIRRAQGIVKGVSDCILLMMRGGYGGLMVEFKTATGYQSEAQKEWQKLVEAQGYKYVVCRSLEEFQLIIDNYLNL
jgi:hypothetical protein